MEFLEPDLGEAAEEVVPREQKEKTKKVKKSIFESGDISSHTPSELVALMNKHIKKALPSVTDVELADLSLHACAFATGSGMNGDASGFERFLHQRLPDWQSLDSQQPSVLIVSASAIRCVELLKYLPNVRKQCTIAKLFAKHMKLPEQKAFLASHRCPVAVGTPARLLKLGQEPEKPIEFSQVTSIVIDTHRDGKDRTVFDVPEIRKELVELLCRTALRERLNDSDCQILFF